MRGATVLVADDDAAIRTVVAEALARRGHSVRATDSAATLWQWVADGVGDVVVTDVVMPDGDGLELLPRIARERPNLPVVVMSARATLMTAVRASEGGAYDYLPKPFDIHRLVACVEQALVAAEAPVDGAEPAVAERTPLIGRSPAMQGVFRAIARLTATDVTTLIVGESGTGKELVARALHGFGKRRDGPFVAVNMAAIPRELIESDLFGHEKGAFTGATARHPGRFEQARGGTLFLDEIGDMPLDAQTRLLRVLQQGEYSPVGSTVVRRADVRIVTATHQDLAALVDAGLFRDDLYYRIAVVPIELPPLRARHEDIPLLAAHFLAAVEAEGLPAKRLEADAMARLVAHDWPGNVRELENLIRRLAVLYPEESIGAEAVAAEIARAGRSPRRPVVVESLSDAVEGHLKGFFAAHDGSLPAGGLYDRILRELERPLIALTLEATRGNQLKAAQVLGINRNTLRKKMRELGITVARGGGA